MIRFTLHGMMLAILMLFVAPASAQAAARDLPACPLPIEADGAPPPAPTAGALPAGCETTTRPWSAPVGHRQPQAADMQAPDLASSASSIDRALLEENARINRLIGGVCRGC